MDIDFGWEFDHCPATAVTVVGSLRCGPRGLASALATRLGVQRPVAEPAQRIARYRAALVSAVAHGKADWCAEAFPKNRWAMAEALLSWRDELVANGWRPHCPRGSSTRLETIAHVESLFDSPGAADVQRDVLERLRQLRSWPLGIERISLRFCSLAQLPVVWQEIFQHLEKLGVAVEEVRDLSRINSVSIVTADTTFEAAAVAARMDAPVVLAGAETSALDHELSLRGQGALGRGQELPSPLIATFLAACTRPYDIRALSTLTMLRVERGPIIPEFVGAVLRTTLAQAAGVGSAQWQAAMEGPLADNEVAQELNALVWLHPLSAEGDISAEDLADHLNWLRARLRALGATELAHEATTLQEILAGTGPVSRRELSSIVDTLSSRTGAVAHAQPGRVVATHPAALPLYGEELLWWAPVDNTVQVNATFTQAEYAQLRGQGIDVPQPEVLAPLRVACQLGVLASYRRITAVIPSFLAGESTHRHPLLLLVMAKVRDASKASSLQPLSVKELSRSVTHRGHELVSGGHWRLGERAVEVVVPPAEPLPAANPFYRTFSGGEHLTPQRLSYSQMSRLLHHPLEWLMHRLGVDPGNVLSLPTGNALLGSFVHKVIEELGGTAVSDDEVARVFNELVEGHAAELTLRGKESARQRLLRDTRQAVRALTTALNAMGAATTGHEEEISDVFLAEVPGADGQPVELRGRRDVDITFRDGTRGLLDLKYTSSTSRFPTEIKNNEELQLAVYARSLSHGPEDLDQHPVAYFSLLQRQFFSPFPIFSPPHHRPVSGQGDKLTALWAKAVVQLNQVLAGLRAGWVFDVDNARQFPDEVELAERLAALYPDGFLTKKPQTYTDFDVLTGLKGDFQ
ncbi:PD-(D/E)XK nuclease family protein [Corynebacterium sp.]|uniref:PD-(D/E)XK nuclease family protein n=1 Tax=Corynebacterium sp. TaxID=1720 RepID=UPI0026DBD716|nr:PD-(D/E)XK nuclease family protein [Corynebacterium sp.]MDO5031086.1 PD-(D/E)XK nuclease family protein [Corynebacterium sp.]